MSLKYIVIAYDPEDCGLDPENPDLYGYIVNELENDRIKCSLAEFEGPEDAADAAHFAALGLGYR